MLHALSLIKYTNKIQPVETTKETHQESTMDDSSSQSQQQYDDPGSTSNPVSGSDPSEEQEDKDHMDVAVSNLPPQTESSTRKRKKMMDAHTATGSANREGKSDEIGLLMDLYALHSRTARYRSLSGSNDDKKRVFYKYWIEEEKKYGSQEELDKKVDELHARFLKNMDKNVEGPSDSVDIEILRVSHWIWGEEIDSEGLSDEDVDSDVRDDHADAKDSPSKGNEDGSSGS